MTPEAFLQHFEILADTPNVVARLRDLVLQLAIQGKLVKQHEADESAERLLERARSAMDDAKRWAAADGEAARWRERAEPPLHDLPRGWVWACNAHLGDTSPRNESADDAIVSFAPMADIPTDYRKQTSFETRRWGDIKKGYTHFADGDVAVAKITPCFQNGKACVMRGLAGGIGAGTTELHVLRPVAGVVEPLYMLMVYTSSAFVRGGVATFTGTAGQQRVSNEYFRYSPIPLPPLAEQKRIVAEVDELMALCDRVEAQQQDRDHAHAAITHAALARFADAPTADNLEHLFHESCSTPPDGLREAVLSLAVRGRLCPQDPRDPPPRVGPEVDGRHDVPASWRWVSFASVGDQRLGKMLDQVKNSGVLRPYLRNTNVQWMRFVLDDVKEMRLEDAEANEFRLQDGDLLICEGGEPGRCAIWRDTGEDMFFQKAIHRVRPGPDVLAEYLAINLRIDARNGVLERYFTGATIKHLTGRSLREYTVPIPPLAEQRRIVAKVNELMALVDRLEADLAAARATGEKLMDAVVAELTARQPAAEPAPCL